MNTKTNLLEEHVNFVDNTNKQNKILQKNCVFNCHILCFCFYFLFFFKSSKVVFVQG